jgi:cytochrome bd-type quinol oxidase subunit 2
MNQLKQRSKLPPLVTVLVVGLIMVYGDTQHLCHLQSTIVEILLLVGVVLASYLWTARAKTSGQAWLRMGLAFVLAIAIEMLYLTWLHSDFFPHGLLSSSAKQRQAELDELRRTERRQQSPGGDVAKTTPQE